MYEGRHHAVMMSSGTGSAAAAKRLTLAYPGHVTMLFADVNGEDPDNYRFLLDATEWIDAPLVILDNGGRTIWDVFRQERFLGNSRADNCSRVLKRGVMRRWLEEHYAPDDVVAHIGYDIDEMHRVKKAAGYWEPWSVDAPLTWEPVVWKDHANAAIREAGIDLPLLTRLGYPHANCGGMCVKMGHRQARKTLALMPDRYAEWERQEEGVRVYLGQRDVAIMRDRTGGSTTPLTLAEFRQRIEQDPSYTGDGDWGSCNCVGDWSDAEDGSELTPDAIDPHEIRDQDEVHAYLTRKASGAQDRSTLLASVALPPESMIFGVNPLHVMPERV